VRIRKIYNSDLAYPKKAIKMSEKMLIYICTHQSALGALSHGVSQFNGMNSTRKPRANLTSMLSILSLVFIASGCHIAKNLKAINTFECNGKVKTMFSEEPLRIRIVGDTLTISTHELDSSPSNSLDDSDNFSLIPKLIGDYEFDIQYPDGMSATRINKNEIFIKHFHVNATLLLDKCTLLYPLEIDTIKNLNNLLFQ